MHPLAFDDLARLPIMQYYETAFRKATGVSVRLLPPAGPRPLGNFKASENGFCALMGVIPQGSSACARAEAQAQAKVTGRTCTQQTHCYAGLTVMATPVIVADRHVATLLSGQVLRREPTERDFQMVMKSLGVGLAPDWVRKARKAYFETPVLDAERFQAAMQLLRLFVQHLVESAGRVAIVASSGEPQAVSSAKQFVRTHAEEPITLDQVVEHVHVSRFHFCKLFKKATGITLTEYVTRVRVEKAKSLLCDRTRRVSEVVFASGFGSVPQFNSVFKRLVGVPPTEYRTKVCSEVQE
jgi:AraC-like DNA-binding protein/ligand-binding sensor protein